MARKRESPDLLKAAYALTNRPRFSMIYTVNFDRIFGAMLQQPFRRLYLLWHGTCFGSRHRGMTCMPHRTLQNKRNIPFSKPWTVWFGNDSSKSHGCRSRLITQTWCSAYYIITRSFLWFYCGSTLSIQHNYDPTHGAYQTLPDTCWFCQSDQAIMQRLLLKLY